MKALLTLVAVAFTAMVSNIVQAEGAGQAVPPPSAQSQDQSQDPKIRGGDSSTSAPAASSSGQAAPDNTGRNKQREQGKPEADDQSNQSGDLELTAKLRRAITEDDSLSMNAHNIKIITERGKVMLRGPVDSDAEKRKIEALARKVAAGRQVASELEVKSEKQKQ